MIDQAKAVAQLLREYRNYKAVHTKAADTIDALVADAEQYKSDWKACTARNRELLAEVERLKQEQAEPVGWYFPSYTQEAFQNGYTGELYQEQGPDMKPLYTAPPDHTALLRQALEALHCAEYDPKIDAAIDAIKEALK